MQSLPFSLVKSRIEIVDILFVQFVFGQAQSLAEALEVDDLPGSEELDGVVDVGIVTHTQDVVIRNPGFLLGGQILGKIGNDVSFDADSSGIPGGTGGGRGIDAGGVIQEIRSKSGGTDLLFRQIPGELMDDGADHLQMAQFLGAYKGVKMEPQTEAACAARDSSLVSGSK